MIDFIRLKDEARQFNVELDDVKCEQFDEYAKLLVEKNKVMNLTGITEPDAIVTRHFADSLSFFYNLDVKQNAKIIDVGSGAGFPGLALKIARPDLKVTLLDSTAKRVNFLSQVAQSLDLDVECVHLRAEDGAKMPQYREQFDLATARAVSEMRVLCEYCLPFVKVGGLFVALKGKDINEELSSAKNSIAVLGGEFLSKTDFRLNDESERNIVLVKKISQTPPKYPRVSAQIAKKPL